MDGVRRAFSLRFARVGAIQRRKPLAHDLLSLGIGGPPAREKEFEWRAGQGEERRREEEEWGQDVAKPGEEE